jgi:hypothetical protein
MEAFSKLATGSPLEFSSGMGSPGMPQSRRTHRTCAESSTSFAWASQVDLSVGGVVRLSSVLAHEAREALWFRAFPHEH